MSAKDYPITFGYGATDGTYYGTSAQGKSTYIGPYHKGDDRAMPVGTPVVVNGTQIGLSGNGNGRYGPHLHVGKFVNGRDTNPNGGGFTLSGAKVIAVVNNFATDPVNAKYVRIQDASGAAWVYLHMSQINVNAGQLLNINKEDEMIGDAAHLNALTMAYFNRGASAEEIARYVGKAEYPHVIEDFDKSSEYAGVKAAVDDANNWKNHAINEFLPQIEELKRQVGDTAAARKLNKLQSDIQSALDNSK